jgi:hypothetical protein
VKRATSWFAVAALATVAALPEESSARTVGAVVAADCTTETKRLKAFQRGMRAAKRRFFRFDFDLDVGDFVQP